MAAALRAMALVRFSFPTSWGMIACLAGIKKAKTAPWPMETAKRWTHVMVLVVMETAMKSARKHAPICPIWMTLFRSIRSAAAPPNRDNESMGRANPPLTRLSLMGEPVSS